MKQWMVNWLLLIMCLAAICFSLLKVTPFEIGEDAFIGTITTLLSLAVAFIIGYQIYNAVELKKDVEEQRQLLELSKKENDEFKKCLVKQQHQTQEGFDIISALQIYNSDNNAENKFNAFAQMHHALLSSIETDRTDYEWIFMHMRKFISELSPLAFTLSGSNAEVNGKYIININNKTYSLSEFIDSQLRPLYDEEDLLRKKANFGKICIEYNRVMKAFSKAIDKIKNNPMENVLPEDFRREILNPT